MRKTRTTTQATYDAVAARFLENTRTPHRSREWVERFCTHVPAGTRVVDLGSGPGRDTAQLQARGLEAFCVDRSLGMLRAGLAEYPAPRVQADLTELPLRTASVTGAWANASLLHLAPSEFETALAEIARVVVPGGYVHLSLKRGEGSEWESERYGRPRWFQYWSEAALDAALARAGASVCEMRTEQGDSAVWLVRQFEVGRRGDAG